MRPLKAKQIYGNWASLILDINDDESINYSHIETQIKCLHKYSVNGVYSNGTAGEFYNQSYDEFCKINSVFALCATQLKLNYQIGASHPCPDEMLRRIEFAALLKPAAIQIILPDWFPLTNQEAIKYFKECSSLATDIGLILYNPPHAKRTLTPQDFIHITNNVPQIIGIKSGAGKNQWYQDIKPILKQVSVFIPGHHMASGILNGAHGSYSNMACLNPLATQQWYKMIQTSPLYALELEQRILQFMNELIIPYITINHRANQACDKFLTACGNWININTKLRFPYENISHKDIDNVRIRGKQIIPEFF